MSIFQRKKAEMPTFSPGLHVEDMMAAYWMRQVTIRLRREICWCRHERGVSADAHAKILPPYMDKASESLIMHRNWEEKQRFYSSDSTAGYLTQQLEAPPPDAATSKATGSLGWIIEKLGLDETAAFVLAMGLVAVFDSAVGSVVSACLNDPTKTLPTLSLAQKLWDQPEQVLSLADPAHPLFASGLLQPLADPSSPGSYIDWDSPITVPTLVSHQLLFPQRPLPGAFKSITAESTQSPPAKIPLEHRQVSAALRSHPSDNDHLYIIPILGKWGSAHVETVRAVGHITGQKIIECLNVPASQGNNDHYLKSIATFCWLKNLSLYLGQEIASYYTASGNQSPPRPDSHWSTLQSIPITIFLHITGTSQLAGIPPHLLLPKIQVPEFSYYERGAFWRELLGDRGKGIEQAIDECSRRFRYEKEKVREIASGLKTLPGPLSANDLVAACRNHLELDLGDLAQKVTPRFKDETLILPHKQQRQFAEVEKAMTSLTEVHYHWGTAEAWNENGISVLFAGPPGTGKTMAAEILARRLDLPMFRIDLSQVVNKYIGETEKNLKQLFDSADMSDIILFFDEADALFGKRTEVKDAHDRYANLEISYLLERMERFKGLAILATNRKKDLDEAFLRRLRYIIDFPSPGVEQRKRIWRQVIPKTIDYSAINIDFLARRFQLTGGHIRSIVFNACLQSVGGSESYGRAKGRLTMEQVIPAIKREYDKMDRAISLENFRSYAGIVKALDQNKDLPEGKDPNENPYHY
jgi:hypothetical protein